MSPVHIPKSEANFEPAPAGSHIAVIFKIVDIGTQQTSWNGQPPTMQRKFRVYFEIPGERMDDGRPFTVSKQYNLSSHEKSTLRKDLNGLFGVRLTDEQIERLDLEKLIGRACQISIEHVAKDGRVHANVVAVTKPMKGAPLPSQPENETLFFWLDREHFSPAAFGKLGKRVQAAIMVSPEYAGLKKGEDDAEDGYLDADQAAFTPKPDDRLDDDILF